MAKPNTLYRNDADFHFGLLAVYARLKEIKYFVFTYTRTAEEQNKRFKNGLSYCDGYKNVSMHQKDRARDIVIINDEGKTIWDHIPEYDILAKFWKDFGGIWGGDWTHKKFDDCYHFEY